MPYLGNIPASEFRTIDYQDFTGVTGNPVKRGFTLTSPVSNANDLEVFVNNVRQEPGVAYTVAGTTLTMTGDVETTDDFYVVYQGKAVGSVVPTDGSVSDVKITAMAASKLTGALPASSFPSGSIIQTQVHQEDGMTYWAYASAAGNDRLLLAADANDSTSHLSVTITPTSATSKILITASLFFEGEATNAQDYLWLLYRDSTKLGQPNVGSRRGGITATSIGSFTANASSTADSVSYSYYDTPNTTSAITYAVAFNFSSNSGNLFLNRTVDDIDSVSYERGVSTIIAQEIAQ